MTGAVEEAYSGRLVIRSFCREKASADEVCSQAAELADANCKADFYTNAVGPAIRFLSRLSQIIIAVVGCNMLVAGRMTVGIFQAFFQYIYTAGEPITQLSYTINSMQGALASVERVFDVTRRAPKSSPIRYPGLAAHVPQPMQGAFRSNT